MFSLVFSTLVLLLSLTQLVVAEPSPDVNLALKVLSVGASLVLWGIVFSSKKQTSLLVGNEAALRQALEESAKSHEKALQALRLQVQKESLERLHEQNDTAVLNFLRQLQERARLLDFALADIQTLADAQVGAAARIVQQGAKALLQDYFDIRAIRNESEGTQITVPEDEASRAEIRLLQAQATESSGPQQGRLMHRGWRAESVRLPQSSGSQLPSARILAPAEIELN